MNAHWTIKSISTNTSQRSKVFAKKFNISPILSTILANRLNTIQVDSYLNSNLSNLNNPRLMKGLDQALVIISQFIKSNELICIYGDYDVDGVSSVTILYKALKKLGANVMFYIPDREKEGYGLNVKTIKKIQTENSVGLFLTCDNGITNVQEIEFIKKSGASVIVIDHHEPLFNEEENQKIEVIPPADAIINPKQSGCKYPFKVLCAGTISFKFIEALYNYLGVDSNLKKDLWEYLVIASIATVCDIVDLVGENRAVTKIGLDIINQNNKINLGLYHLLKVLELTNQFITEEDYGFKIGPCINACGRLEHASLAVKLLTTESPQEAESLANQLFNLNLKRKDLTNLAVDTIVDQLENSNLKDKKVIVIYNQEIHESLAGIVAGKIKESLYKPTFIITKSNDGVKGSGRSIPSYDMFKEMNKCSHLFTKFGGHQMAAGLSLKEENLQEFSDLINSNCILQDDDLKEVILIDKAINFCDINLNLATELNQMRPFGKDNESPIFATKSVRLINLRIVGGNKILQLDFIDSNGYTQKAISFNGYTNFVKLLSQKYTDSQVQALLNGEVKEIQHLLDIVYFISVNSFRGVDSVQLNLKDFRFN